MNAESTRDGTNPGLDIGLLFLRLLLGAAWIFNFVTLAATLMHAWRSENPGRLLGVGLVVVWLLCLGVVTWRTCQRGEGEGPRS